MKILWLRISFALEAAVSSVICVILLKQSAHHIMSVVVGKKQSQNC